MADGRRVDNTEILKKNQLLCLCRFIRLVSLRFAYYSVLTSIPMNIKMIQSNGKTVLVTGGAGYIGSHCIVSLQEAGYKVIALDNFANAVCGPENQPLPLKRVEKITGIPVTFYKCDLLDTESVNKIFQLVSCVWSSLTN